MNEEIKKEWIERLRSDKYEQGEGALARQHPDFTEYCCLGVLCEIAVEAGIVKKEVRTTHIAYNSVAQILPDAVVAWAGLKEPNPNCIDPAASLSDRNTCLGELNDLGVPFSEIADIIEEQF